MSPFGKDGGLRDTNIKTSVANCQLNWDSSAVFTFLQRHVGSCWLSTRNTKMHLRVQARLRGHRAQSDIALQPLTVNVNDDGGRDSQGTERPPQLPPQIQKALPGSKRHPVVQFCRRNCLRLIRLPLAAVAIPSSVFSLTKLRPFPQERNYKSYKDLYQPLTPAAVN